MAKCPLTKGDCTVDCAWFKDGECATTSLISTLDLMLDLMLDDVVSSIDSLKNTIENKDFTT